MNKKVWVLAMISVVFFAAPAFADIDQAVATVAEGAVEFPVGLVKLVGGLVWTIGEAIALPFRMIF